MSHKSISNLTSREAALIILSKLLYATSKDYGVADIICFHKKTLNSCLGLSQRMPEGQEIDNFSLLSIPWTDLLSSIANRTPFLKAHIQSKQFSEREILYMCAMLCGLSGIEYRMITGYRSHYNLSWLIRQKLGLPPKSTNLRIFLQKLSASTRYESSETIAQK